MRSFISVVVMFTLLAGSAVAQGRKKKRVKAAKIPAARVAPAAVSPEHPDGVRRMTPAEAFAAQEKGTALIVDVRSEAGYQAGHIKGAILIPGGEIGAHLGRLPRNKTIITYCS